MLAHWPVLQRTNLLVTCFIVGVRHMDLPVVSGSKVRGTDFPDTIHTNLYFI